MTADLRVAPISFDAAKYAVMHWHYSRAMPVAKLYKIGAWEAGRFIGCVLFSRGATRELGWPYGLDQTSCVELTRVALRDHVAPVSQIVAEAIRLVKRNNPGLRLIVSFADENQGHHGGIYQAGNWIYAGPVKRKSFRVNGEIVHPRTLTARYNPRGGHGQSLKWLRANVDPDACTVEVPPKHRYLMPLDRKMRRQIAGLAQPYPERVKEATS